MATLSYARPTTIAQAVAILDRYGPAARVLAGGTDLIIGLRDGTIAPAVVVDLKRIPDFQPTIREADGRLTFSAIAVMADISMDPAVRRYFPALAEAARVVGSVQIRNRATLAGNICNASPAADTAPPLLVYGAQVVTAGPDESRTIPMDDFFIRSGETALRRGELVTAIELPLPTQPVGASFLRMTRRRGTDLASVTMCVAVEGSGVTRIAYGSVGPRPYLVTDESGVLADRSAPREARATLLDSMFGQASPSPRSLRAGPAYRLAMLRVLGERALETAIDRLAGAA
jgi:CO/xanthine dehydrogenase FAD-binding subunit